MIDGFAVEKIYHVPRAEQGSWVSLTVAADGRLIASDQEGALYRITPAPLGSPSTLTRVEQVESDLGSAHGLTSAFGGLYVTVNRGTGIGVGAANGLHRMDDGDGELGPARQLRHLDGIEQRVPAPDPPLQTARVVQQFVRFHCRRCGHRWDPIGNRRPPRRMDDGAYAPVTFGLAPT